MDFASQGYDIIFGHGFQFQEPLIAVAEMFPETAYCLALLFDAAELRLYMISNWTPPIFDVVFLAGLMSEYRENRRRGWSRCL
jgi:hypothetical protein